jgi:hypothetical protein
MSQLRKSSLTPSQLFHTSPQATDPEPLVGFEWFESQTLSATGETSAPSTQIGYADDHGHAHELSCEEFERLGHEVRAELKHRAVSGIRIDDEVAIRKTPRQIVRVRAWHHAITIAVGDKHRLVNL